MSNLCVRPLSSVAFVLTALLSTLSFFFIAWDVFYCLYFMSFKIGVPLKKVHGYLVPEVKYKYFICRNFTDHGGLVSRWPDHLWPEFLMFWLVYFMIIFITRPQARTKCIVKSIAQ